MMPAGEIYNSHYSATAHHAHLGRHTFAAAPVDDKIIIGTHPDFVAHHPRWYEPVALKFVKHPTVGIGCVVLCVGKCLTQGTVFLLQADVGIRKGTVHLTEFGEGYGTGIGTVDGGCHLVGTGKPYISLIPVEADQHEDADDFQYQKEEQIVIAAQEVEKHLHISGFLGRIGRRGDGGCGNLPCTAEFRILSYSVPKRLRLPEHEGEAGKRVKSAAHRCQRIRQG